MTAEKLKLKQRYLNGEEVAAIARSKGIATRVVYYHMGQLTPDDIATHAKNKIMRKRGMAIDKTGMPVTNITITPHVKQSTGNAKRDTIKDYGQDISDFIQG
jgi:hypothetical protein